MRRNSAINNLRGFGAFRHVSLRLIEDLIDTVGTGGLASGAVEDYVDYARRASFSLYWSLDLQFWDEKFRTGSGVPRAHEICLCASPSAGAPLEALGHLLASAIAEQFDEPAAVVDLKAGTLSAWHNGSFVGPHVLAGATDTASILHEIDRILPGKRPFIHLVYVVAKPRLTPALAERFHRIVYVNQRPDVAAVPAYLRDLLKPAVWGDDPQRLVPRFSSFIATQFLGERPEPAASDADCLASLGAGMRALGARSSLRTQPTGDAFDSQPRPSLWRLRRDRVRLAVDLAEVHRAWRDVASGRRHALFATELFARRPAYKASVDRWARAVTNRQVGMALSAGGASAYRMVPLIRSFAGELEIPIDVVAGAAGGTLIAAYYSAEGLQGLDKAIAQGEAFTLLGLGAFLSSGVMRAKVDWDLAAARIERLEMRCVPLATLLDDRNAPATHAVVGGTLGEAVGASGCVPVLCAPRIARRRRYAGGDTAFPAPARALREHGADVVFAVNCVPGPTVGNPLSHYLDGWAPFPLGDLLSNLTPLGRAIDAWVGTAFLRQQSSRAMEADAHVHLEPQSSSMSLLESLKFYDAAHLVEETEEELDEARGMGRDLARCASVWQRFRRSPRL